MTASKDQDTLARTLSSGASGIRGQILDQARRSRAERSRALSPFKRLTEREAQVLRLLADGLPVASIARRWLVSEATVRSHVRAILTKLGAGTQLEAVAAAHRSGWL